MTDDLIFFEAMARASERDFMVLGAGFLVMHLWQQLTADRLSQEQIHWIECTKAATNEIPDAWQFARTALRDVLNAVISRDSDVVIETALARYAASVARLAPDVGALVLRRVKSMPARTASMSRMSSFGETLADDRNDVEASR